MYVVHPWLRGRAEEAQRTDKWTQPQATSPVVAKLSDDSFRVNKQGTSKNEELQGREKRKRLGDLHLPACSSTSTEIMGLSGQRAARRNGDR
jgi:hypothetical protein